MKDWQQLASIIAVVGAIVVTSRYLWKNIPVAYRKLRNNMFGIGELKTDIAALSVQVNFVVDEFKPNGGKGLRDCVNRIELRQLFQEQRQWAILEDMSVGVFETNAEGEYYRVNRKYLRMTGRSPNEVKGSGWINTVANRDRERVQGEWDAAISEGREFESDFLLITPEDERVQVSARTYKLSDHDKQAIGYLGMLAPLD